MVFIVLSLDYMCQRDGSFDTLYPLAKVVDCLFYLVDSYVTYDLKLHIAVEENSFDAFICLFLVLTDSSDHVRYVILEQDIGVVPDMYYGT